MTSETFRSLASANFTTDVNAPSVDPHCLAQILSTRVPIGST